MHRENSSTDRAWQRPLPDASATAPASSTANLCHDLRQHLGALRNLVAVLQSTEELSLTSRVTLDAMTEELAAASSMIVSELAAAREGPSLVDVGQVAAAAALTLKRRHGADVILRTVGRSRMLGREVEVRRAVANLLDNAHGADPDGTVELTVISQESRVLIEVLDEGRGFGTSPAGNGLGLGQVRATAKEFGGLLLIEDRETGGTRVRLSFPRVKTFAS